MVSENGIEWPQDDKWEWEYLRDIFLKLISEVENGLAKAVRVATIRPLHNGHAYSVPELKDLGSILRIKGPQPDIVALQSETDAFAAYVGLRLRSERKLTSKMRIKEIKSRFFEPADSLLKTLNDPEFSKEFLVPWSGFDHERLSDLKSGLEHAIVSATTHIETIRNRASKGKQWDASLKRFHVYLASCLCEYLNHDFEPKRMNAEGKEEVRMFHEAVTLLAKPLFERGRSGNSGFSGAIREHIDNWNAAKRELWQEITKHHADLTLGQS